MIIDNLPTLLKLIDFEEGDYYKFEAIIRSKDGLNPLCTNPNSTSIKYWLISNWNELDKLYPVMQEFCNITGARLYMTLDRKNIIKTFINTSKNLFDTLTEMMYGSKFSIHKLNKIIASETSKKDNSAKNCRTWMIDIDIDDEYIKQLTEEYLEDLHICTLKTPNGYHVISDKKFGADRFIDLYTTFLSNHKDNLSEDYIKTIILNVSLKENALGLVYFNRKEL